MRSLAKLQPLVANSLDECVNVSYSLQMNDIRQTFEFTRWFAKLKDRNGRARIMARLLRVAEGNMGDYKSLGNGLFEFRLAFGPGYRLYFCYEDNKIIILLAGGDKSTQERDVGKALEILKGLQQ